MNTHMEQSAIEELGIWKAATLDGYWEIAATDDIQYVFLLGQLRATESIHLSNGRQMKRIKILRSKIEEVKARLLK